MNKVMLLTTNQYKFASGFVSTMLAIFWLNGTPARAAEPLSAGQQPQSFSRQVSKTVTANYLLYLPKDYKHDKERRWPLIIFLHGAGERGDDLSKIKVNGLPKLLETNGDFPFIVISPQVPKDSNWDIDVLDALLDEALEQLPVDPSRVYLTGLSMGGYATWEWAIQRPERFAAIAPVCGSGLRYRACRLSHVPVWAFHGDQDPIVPFREDELMVKDVQSCGGEAQLTTYAGGGHDAWTETYANPELYNWFLKHRLGSKQE
ncbi:MAG: carboxylesterase family protein [Methylotenera sp.]